MNNKPHRIAILLTCAVAALAQTAPDPSLMEYLSLTVAQKEAIDSNNASYTRASLQKQQRLVQVEQEIREETTRDPLDPGALGVRYAEMETACRELADEARKVRERNVVLLNDAQKAKVRALEEALRLLPLAQESQGAGLVAFERPLSVLLPVSTRAPTQGVSGGIFPWPPGVLPLTSCLLNPLGIAVRTQQTAIQAVPRR